MGLEERIISIYLQIDTIYTELTAGRSLRYGGFAPALSDVEVLTIEVLGEIQNRNGDRAIWQYIQDHWLAWFPRLGAYKTFAKHCANLCWVKQRILPRLFPPTDMVHSIDGVPLPVCHNARANRSRQLQESAAWGFCAAKDEHYYGLKGHVALHCTISAFVVTPANVDERQVLWDIAGKIEGLLIGDKGYIGVRHC